MAFKDKEQIKVNQLCTRIRTVSNDPELNELLKTYCFTFGELKLIRRQLVDKRRHIQSLENIVEEQLALEF